MAETGADKAFTGAAATFRYEKDKLARWMNKGGGKRGRYLLYIILLAFLTVNFGMTIPTSPAKGLPIFITVVCLAGIGVLVFFMKKNRSTVQVDTLYAEGNEYRVFFKEDSFKIGVQGTEKTVSYDDGVRVQETERCFYLHYGEKELFIVPKEALGDEQSQRLSQYFIQRLGKAYKFGA